MHTMRERQFLNRFIDAVRELTDPCVSSTDCLHKTGVAMGARFRRALIDLDKWSS